MFTRNNWPISRLDLSILAALTIVMGFFGLTPARAAIILDHKAEETVQLEDGEGRDLGSATHNIELEVEEDGQVSGFVFLQLERDVTYRLTFERVEAFLVDDNGQASGIELSGQGVEIIDGQERAVEFTYRVEKVAENCCLVQLWGAEMSYSGLRFEVAVWHFNNGWPSKVSGPQPKADE